MYVCVYIINLSSVNVLTESSIFLFLCFLIASNQSAYYIKGSLMLLKVELNCQSLKLFSCYSCILRGHCQSQRSQRPCSHFLARLVLAPPSHTPRGTSDLLLVHCLPELSWHAGV